MSGQVLIEPAQLQQAMTTEPIVVIDTRDPGAYAKGHIPGAINLREIFTYLATTDHEGLEAMQHKFAEAFGAAGLSGKETAVVYEDAPAKEAGVRDVKIYFGSWNEWSRAPALPIEEGFPAA